MATVNYESQFHAAVSVIKSLPKNGPFQPSYEMMKKFYGLYKQATEGQCTKPKPAFWDIIGRQKWDAWSNLGDMSKQEAMSCYVNELKKTLKKYNDPDKINKMLEKFPESGKMMEMMHVYQSDPRPEKIKEIVEAMPHTPEVALFVKNLGPFFEAITDNGPMELNANEKPLLPNGNATIGNSESSENETHPFDVSLSMLETTGQENGTHKFDLEGTEEESLTEEEEDEDDDVEEEDEEEVRSEEEELENGEMKEDSMNDGRDDGRDGGNSGIDENGGEEVALNEDLHIVDNKAYVMEVKPIDKSAVSVKKEKKDSESDEDGFVRVNGEYMNGGSSPKLTVAEPTFPHALTSDTDSGDEIFCDSVEKQYIEDEEIPKLIPSPDMHDVVTSTPNKSSFTVQAEVYDKPSVRFRKPEISHIMDGRDSVVRHGGGGGGGGDERGGSHGNNESHSRESQGGMRGGHRGSPHRTPLSGKPSRGTGATGGSGGRGNRQNSPPKGDVNEQIAVALERLQQDMNSVLIRLNTLETLSLRQQTETQQGGMWAGARYPTSQEQTPSSWWPLSGMSGKTVFFIIVWPFICNWVIKYLARRRQGRRL
ncbi:acyl-CoA-binding domain-containing protein 5-like [Saccoglossus kowalevskii]|uniref:Acyl-CoA-binding domain-containing protein 5A-like n=1 Tax=Saccoglossus kowalevskii TaxID=10224 RepID=A0ABM0MI32_SACKO|nr:PREDICTED: acyl-CoA-binding domain-containing protein 5A-like [Saccoglossus kowalevskii]